MAPRDSRYQPKSEKRKKQNSDAAKRNIANGTNIISKIVNCPHCSMAISMLTFARSHGDKCEVFLKEQRSIWLAKSKKLR